MSWVCEFDVVDSILAFLIVTLHFVQRYAVSLIVLRLCSSALPWSSWHSDHIQFWGCRLAVVLMCGHAQARICVRLAPCNSCKGAPASTCLGCAWLMNRHCIYTCLRVFFGLICWLLLSSLGVAVQWQCIVTSVTVVIQVTRRIAVQLNRTYICVS